jgi:hypothetical protein
VDGLTQSAAVVYKLILVGFEHRLELYEIGVLAAELLARPVKEEDDVARAVSGLAFPGGVRRRDASARKAGTQA